MQVNTSYRDILKIAFPVMMGSIATTVLNVTDTAFLGRVGEVELGGSAIGGVFYFVLVMIGVAVGIGAQILIARRAGEKNDAAIGEIFDHSLLILFVLSLLLFCVAEFCAPFMLRYFLKSQEVIDASIVFLKYRAIGIIFLMLVVAIRSFYVGIALPRLITYYSILMAVVNFILDYLLIFGNHGFPKLGIAGAAIASTTSEFIALIYIIIYTLMRDDVKKFNLFRLRKVKREIISKIINLSTPLVVQNAISMGAWFVFFVFIEKLGEHPLAVSNIVRSGYMINMTPIWGFSIAANSMVSNVIGQNRRDEVMGLINRIIWLAMIASGVMIIINLAIPYTLMSIFTSDVVLIQDSLSCLRIVDIAMIAFPFAIVCISAVSGTGATKAALIIEIAAIIIYIVYNVVVVFYMHLSVEAVWFSEVIYWLFTGGASYIFLRSSLWKKINI